MSKFNITGISIPLSCYTPSTEFVVVGQSEILKFEDNRPTGEISGVKLELFDSELLERLDCKIPNDALPFKDDAVNSKSIKINLVNPTVTPYGELKRDKKGEVKSITILGSIKADGYKEVKKA